MEKLIAGIAEKLPNALLDNKGFEELVRAICLISSYLKSEQDKRLKLTDRMDEHQRLMNTQMKDLDKVIWGDKQNLEENPGIAFEFAMNRKQRKRNEKLITAVLIAIIGQSIVLLKILLK